MARKRTGLRNKFRHGRGSYSVMGKSRTADRYGQCASGKQLTPDSIAGHQLVALVAKPKMN